RGGPPPPPPRGGGGGGGPPRCFLGGGGGGPPPPPPPPGARPPRDRPMLWARSLGYRQTFDFACLVAHCAALPRRINFAAFTVTPAAFSDCPPSLA
ncbi:hypothetical protein EJ607_12450, partial [Pseudomonas aeruginosa]